MPVEFDFSELNATIDALTNQMGNGYDNQELAAAGRATVEAYADEMMDRFISFSHGGGWWEPLAESTILKRAHDTEGDAATSRAAKSIADSRRVGVVSSDFPILYVTGALYNSLELGGGGNEFVVDGDQIIYGTQIPYAWVQQYGDLTNTWFGHAAPIPARPFLVSPGPNITSIAAESHARAVVEGL